MSLLTTKELRDIRQGFENCREAIGWDYVPPTEALRLRGGEAGLFFTDVLRARDRSVAGQVAPPHGLVLWEVGYPDHLGVGA